MREMEYSPESDFNVSYDGKSMVITACGDKESREDTHTASHRRSAGDGNRKRGVYILSRTAESRSSRDGPTAIENAAFRGCGNLVDAVLSKDLRTIGALSFAGCSKLKRVTMGNCLERFEMNSFRDCTELREIVIWHREKQQYMSFAVSSGRGGGDLAVSAGVMSATAPHDAYMDKYDATFLEIKGSV